MTDPALLEKQIARNLRSLYFTRAFVQFVWAGLILLFVPLRPDLAIFLLVFYPLFDAACSLYDMNRNSQAANGAKPTQYINAAIGGVTAFALTILPGESPLPAIFVFGAWALAAGALQIAVGIARRKYLGGQWAMVLSGLQSALAGTVLIIHSFSNKAQVKDLGVYAIGGAVYFMIAGLLLLRRRRKANIHAVVK
ncbi:DUF308 domain-containing protein [Sphingomonas sp. PAMC 26605]|uniref:DUF308 domain-containing protein n=1 Tax=Sphingomonas sp. PAMC 26605 TaxID=1112214 RepID=UPI00026CD7F6|nr:DUF308 domain-containing protein [Sphingomonas sp. PAMC 26605]